MRTLGVAAMLLVPLTAAALIIFAVTRTPPPIKPTIVLAPVVVAPTPPTPTPEPTPAPEPVPVAIAPTAPQLGTTPDLPAVQPKPKIVATPKPTPTLVAVKPAEPPQADPLPMPVKQENATGPRAEDLNDPEQTVRNTIRLSMSAFESCYQNSLRRDSRIKGRIVVSVGVAASGKVSSAKIDETNIRDDGVISCITARLKALRFPPLGEDVDVTVPLSLVPREG